MDAFVEREACEFQEEFGVPLPCNVMLHMMGLPPADLDLLLAIKEKIIHPQGGATGEEMKRDGVTVANAYFDKALDERLASPADDLLSDLVNKTVEGDQRFTRVEILRVCLALLLGGLDAPAAGLGCVMAYLARNPDRRRGLVESRLFLAGAVSELMRTEAPIMYVTRTTLRKVRVAGQKIPAGTTVLLLVGSASADENVFPDADQVDFERDPNPHLAFGLGRHRCIGEHLAQMVIEVALEEWHRRIPEYAIKKGETLIYRPVIRSPERLPLEWGSRVRT
jgi:cytochrome P450